MKPCSGRSEERSYIVVLDVEEEFAASDTVVCARIDWQVKEKAAMVLADTGLSAPMRSGCC